VVAEREVLDDDRRDEDGANDGVGMSMKEVATDVRHSRVVNWTMKDCSCIMFRRREGRCWWVGRLVG
jgi:hypothetical protein